MGLIFSVVISSLMIFECGLVSVGLIIIIVVVSVSVCLCEVVLGSICLSVLSVFIGVIVVMCVCFFSNCI